MGIEEYLGLAFFGLVFLLFVFWGGNEDVNYPPKDEKGRPMKACFSSRNGRFMWVRQSDD